MGGGNEEINDYDNIYIFLLGNSNPEVNNGASGNGIFANPFDTQQQQFGQQPQFGNQQQEYGQLEQKYNHFGQLQQPQEFGAQQQQMPFANQVYGQQQQANMMPQQNQPKGDAPLLAISTIYSHFHF